eukprot:TRINITY_DN5638_c0_g1_i1.p2 TRINITY_DN5638_c0_g1~~TRINITY_DN5638_c0_g1_i1.p2  ORF type:complete len:132 (+),score=11.33 TRINITY_DN5638_c0_g1_i1:537-932(+)
MRDGEEGRDVGGVNEMNRSEDAKAATSSRGRCGNEALRGRRHRDERLVLIVGGMRTGKLRGPLKSRMRIQLVERDKPSVSICVAFRSVTSRDFLCFFFMYKYSFNTFENCGESTETVLSDVIQYIMLMEWN